MLSLLPKEYLQKTFENYKLIFHERSVSDYGNSRDEHVAHCKALRDHLIDRVLKEIPDTFLNGTREDRHPGNANITFEYIEGEAILLLLNQFGISVSTGSACSSASLEPSHVPVSYTHLDVYKRQGLDLI